MSIAVSAIAAERFARPDAQIGVLFELTTLRRIFITVTDFSAASGAVVTINDAGSASTRSVTEGVEFAAGTSNAATAASLYLALGDLVDTEAGFPPTIAAGVQPHYTNGGNRIVVVCETTTPTVTITGSGILTTPGLSDSVTFDSHNFDEDFISHSIADVDISGLRLDPITRLVSQAGADITVNHTELVRELISTMPMMLLPAKIKIYDRNSSIDTTTTIFSFMVNDVLLTRGGATFKLSDATYFLDRIKVSGASVSRRPLNLMTELCRRAGFTSENPLIDLDALDQSDLPDELQGFCVSRLDRGIGWPTRTDSQLGTASPGGSDVSSLYSLLSEVSGAVGGSFFIGRQSGKGEFSLHVPSASVDWNFTEDDFLELEPQVIFDNVITRLDVEMGGGFTSYPLKPNSKYRLIYQGSEISDFSINNPYLNSVGLVLGFETVASATTRANSMPHFSYDFPDNISGGWLNPDLDTIVIADAGAAGFVGTEQTQGAYAYDAGQPFNGAPWEAPDGFHCDTSGLPDGVILLELELWSYNLDENEGSKVSREFVACVPDVSEWGGHHLFTNPGELNPTYGLVYNKLDPIKRPYYQQYTIDSSFNGFGGTAGRGLFGTTPLTRLNVTDIASAVMFAKDITLAHLHARRIIDRFYRGAPIIRFTLPIKFIGIDVGDFFQISDFDGFAAYGHPTIEDIIFEVTSVDVTLANGNKSIQVEGVYLRNGAGLISYDLPDEPTEAPAGTNPTSGGGGSPPPASYLITNQGDDIYIDSTGDGRPDIPVIRG